MKIAFNSITPALMTQRKSVHELCRQFSRSPSHGNLKRLKALFSKCGDGVFIEAGFHTDYANNIYLGDRVYININCTMLDAPRALDASYVISIGDDCLLGPNVQLLAVSHDMRPELRQTTKQNYADAITLHNNVWLGAGVIVLGGVTIGENSVIGAGSVVTKNVAANSFYAGNPAKMVRSI